MTGSPEPRSDVALRIRGVSKAFGATQALDDVSFDLERGSIHALIGGNGSGKSTLIKTLAGVQFADAGQIEVGETIHDLTRISPEVARAAGLVFVHQQSSTFPDLTVAENLHLGRGFETARAGRISWPAVRRRTEEILERYGIDADPDAQIQELGPATQTMVTIARALQDQEGASGGVLVLDEPTASLSTAEVELLLTSLRRYASAGQTIMLVTHRLDEVLGFADRATVLRDGRVVRTVEAEEMTHDVLVEQMVGRALERRTARPEARVGGKVAIEVKNLHGGRVRSASFSVKSGTIVGIAGMVGSGRSTLLRLLFGVERVDGGTITVKDQKLHASSPTVAMASGIAYVPEDRPREAAFPELSVTENMSMAVVPSYWHRGHLNHRAQKADAQELVESFLVRAASVDARFASLSGGNQQKVILARWLRRRPDVLLLDEPTQGVDVAAKTEIYELVRNSVNEGAAAILVSSELEELELLCDRVLIMCEGEITGEVVGEDVSEEKLERLAYGGAQS